MAQDQVKRQAIRDLLAQYSEDTYPGDRAIARELGCSNHLVYAVRTGHRRGADPVASQADATPISWRGWAVIGGIAAAVVGGAVWVVKHATA